MSSLRARLVVVTEADAIGMQRRASGTVLARRTASTVASAYRDAGKGRADVRLRQRVASPETPIRVAELRRASLLGNEHTHVVRGAKECTEVDADTAVDTLPAQLVELERALVGVI